MNESDFKIINIKFIILKSDEKLYNLHFIFRHLLFKAKHGMLGKTFSRQHFKTLLFGPNPG